MANNKKKKKQHYSTKTGEYTVVYNEKQYQQDLTDFQNVQSPKNVNWQGFQRLMLRDICCNSRIIETNHIGDYKLSDIRNALKHPYQSWQKIIGVSETLMHISPQYMRLNNLFANMALFQWWVDLYDVSDNLPKQKMLQLKKKYQLLSAQLEKMNLKHEFSKIMRVLPYQDIYCGLVIESNDDFFIQQIDYRICKLYQVQDGIYNFAINLSGIKPQNIMAYPDYVQKEYLKFVNQSKETNVSVNKLQSSWYLPPADKQVCVKFNSNYNYPFPILINLIQDILDLDTYKKLKLQSARTDNYKAILMKVPIDENTVDKPLLTPDTLGVFAEINRESMSDDIGLIYTLGSSGEAISFKDSSNSRNNVADATENIYNSSGVTQELFNGSSSATAVNFSIENDSGYVYNVYRQLERWINRFIKIKKYNKPDYKFHFYLLDTTIFNRDNVSKRYKEACSLGLSVVDKWLASLDMTPSRMMGSFILHKNIFDFENNVIHLSSSFNSSNTNSSGRPTNESNGELLDTAGEQTANNESNDR